MENKSMLLDPKESSCYLQTVHSGSFIPEDLSTEKPAMIKYLHSLTSLSGQMQNDFVVNQRPSYFSHKHCDLLKNQSL